MARRPSSWPTFRQLELFLSLASAESIAGAGAKLGMSPSATSHALRALETVLGAELIDRNSQDIALTFTAEQILPHIRDMFASLQIAQATALAGAEMKSGFLKIGSFGASATTRVLPPILERFKARYPGIEVLVTEKPDEHVARDLVERRLELAVVTLPKMELETQTLAIDELVAVLPMDHPLASLDTIHVSQMTHDPFILTRAGSQELVSRLFSRNNLKPRVTYDALQLMSILELVAKGKGISLLAKLALPDYYPGTVFRKVVPSTTRRMGLACLNAQRLSPAAKGFWLESQRLQPESAAAR